MFSSDFARKHKVEIYPREGTETNLSSHKLVRLTLKFIPVRGRKRTEALVTRGAADNVEIYPREGTETQSFALHRLSSRVEIYPREGTETPVVLFPSEIQSVEIYPREGTETIRAPPQR